jgi:beta-phosphoglucomutase
MADAVIFDMDGVLIDSYQAHYESWRQLANELGSEFTEREFARTFGWTSREIIALTWGDRGFDEGEIRRLDDRKEALYREIIDRHFPESDGAQELIHAARSAGFRLAVGSSGPPENVDLVVRHLGGALLFDAIVHGRDVQRGKPDPQVFELAASRLGVAPSRCVVIEDAAPGIEAAARAGMASVALLATGRSPADFESLSPSLMVKSLRELSPSVLKSLTEALRR